MTLPHPMVFLVDVDNTLLDNDGIQQDLKDHVDRAYGRAVRDRYWRILEDLFAELGYRDYLGALQRYCVEHPREIELLSTSSFLIDYPVADRQFPAALKVLKRLSRLTKSPEDLFFELALADLTQAADLFRPIFAWTDGVDGWVSLEVSPILSHDTKVTLAVARDLHQRGGKPNLLIKIPGAAEGCE